MNRFFLLPLLLCIVIVSCKKDPVINNQDVEPITFMFHDTLEFPVSSLAGINLPWAIPGISVTTGFQEEVGNLNPLVAAVENITLKALDLEIVSPANLGFDWLKHMTLYIDAAGESRVELAHIFSNPDGSGSRISLDPASNKLDNYVRSDSYQLDAEVTVDQLLLQDITLRSYMTFEVTLINY